MAYGAKGDGATDDTASINAAITAASAIGGIVFFPAGKYKITKTLVVSSQGVRLVGASRNGAIIMLGMPTGDGVQLLGSWGGVEEVQFASSVTRTSGAYISNSDGTKAGWFVIINSCQFQGGYDCIRGDGGVSGGVNLQAQDLFVENCNFIGFTNIGIGLGESVGISNVYVSSCEFTCPTQAVAGISVGLIGSGLYLSQVDLFQTGWGININPPTGTISEGIFLDQVQCDTCAHNGLAANSAFVANPGIVYGLFVTNSWFQGNGNDGFQIGYYNTVSGVQLTGCQMLGNSQAGLSIEQHASQVAVTGCLVGGNSQVGNFAASGINVAGGAQDVTISGSVVGPVFNFPNRQKWGVWFGGAVTRVALSGNSLSNNGSGKYNAPLPAGAQDFGSV